MDLLAGVVTVAPALALALTGAAALPGVLALAGAKPVLGLVDVAVDHELAGLLILLPVVGVQGLLVGEELSEVVGQLLSGGGRSEEHTSELQSP